MSDIDDIINGASERLAKETQLTPPNEELQKLAKESTLTPPPEAASEEATLDLTELKAFKGRSAILVLEDSPLIQKFYCSQGHLLGAISQFHELVIFTYVRSVGDQLERWAKCLVCGEEREIPDYDPSVEEPHAEG